ncbi:MAG: phosphatidate cytidylyltransferase [Clostridia bacterium]|nr:phosphatidate cytidylyltransferase [Clostridia bacterium]
MKTRIITGVLAGALMLLILFLPWSIVLTVATSLITAIAVYEVFTVTGIHRHGGVDSVAIVFALIAPFLSRMPGRAATITCLMYVVMLLLLMALYCKEIPAKRLAAVFAVSLIVTFSLSCISYIRTVPSPRDSDGLFYIILAMMAAWVADTGAYFVGSFFGKHKPCPRLSPKKTVEGLVGGMVFSVVFCLLTGWVYQLCLGDVAEVSYIGIFLLALICAPLSVVGDLFASLIKRICKVKDYGNIFPGHGGMMDRFDSLLFVLPVVYFTARVLPLVG